MSRYVKQYYANNFALTWSQITRWGFGVYIHDYSGIKVVARELAN